MDYATPAPRGSEHRLVTVRRFPAFEAELARAKLESEGIAAFIDDTNLAITGPFLVSDVPVMVSENDLQRATEILDQPSAPLEEEEDEPDDLPQR
jgi:hypothetical protein